MPRCGACGAALLQGTDFCLACDHQEINGGHLPSAYAMADEIAALESETAVLVAEASISVPIICPYCEHQFSKTISALAGYRLRCGACRKSFRALIAEVRDTRSRSRGRSIWRDCDVRVQNGVQEGLISYSNEENQDHELRRGDLVVFSGSANNVRLLQNVTMGQYSYVTQWRRVIDTIKASVGLVLVIAAQVWLFG